MTQERYLVRQLAGPDELRHELSGPVTVAEFATRDEAEADRLAREREQRRDLNPFALRHGRVAALTSLDPAVLCDWLLDHGIDPPAAGGRDWAAWWQAEAPRWSPAQRDQVWDRLDRLRFFDVAGRVPPRRAYIVVEVGWRWIDHPPWYTDAESRRPVEAFASRARADERRAEMERQARAGWRGGCEWFALADPYMAPGTDRLPLAEAPMFEVVEIDWEAGA